MWKYIVTKTSNVLRCEETFVKFFCVPHQGGVQSCFNVLTHIGI